MFVLCGEVSGLCEEVISHSGESKQVCVFNCVRSRTFKKRWLRPDMDSCAMKEKKSPSFVSRRSRLVAFVQDLVWLSFCLYGNAG
jgi:hypothetical protein